MVFGVDRGNLGADISTPDAKMMVAGVSTSLGGDDAGPTPHQYLEAALAACTIITVKMYAQRRELPLISTHVEVSTLEESGSVTLKRKISFKGDLTDENKSKLLEIANKCPIHKLLTGTILVQTTHEDSL